MIGPEAHRDGRVFPEVGHQPRVRIRGEAAAGRELAAEVLQLLRRQPSLEERAGVDPGRRVPLEVDDVAVAVLPLAAEEVVEADFVQRRGGRIGRDVAANPVRRPVAAHDHRHGVPADQALDPALDFLAAGERDLLFGTNRVDVRGDSRERQADALHAGVVAERGQQPLHAAAISLLDDVVERLAPLPLFDGLDLRRIFRCDLPHFIVLRRLRVRVLSWLQSSYCSPRRARRLARVALAFGPARLEGGPTCTRLHAADLKADRVPRGRPEGEPTCTGPT